MSSPSRRGSSRTRPRPRTWSRTRSPGSRCSASRRSTTSGPGSSWSSAASPWTGSGRPTAATPPRATRTTCPQLPGRRPPRTRPTGSPSTTRYAERWASSSTSSRPRSGRRSSCTTSSGSRSTGSRRSSGARLRPAGSSPAGPGAPSTEPIRQPRTGLTIASSRPLSSGSSQRVPARISRAWRRPCTPTSAAGRRSTTRPSATPPGSTRAPCARCSSSGRGPARSWRRCRWTTA
jgi:hypothetical protein